MDVEPMWATDRVVAPTPGSSITIPETVNEFAIKAVRKSFLQKLEDSKPQSQLNGSNRSLCWQQYSIQGAFLFWYNLEGSYIRAGIVECKVTNPVHVVLNKVVLEFPQVFWDDPVDCFGAGADESDERGWFFMFWNVKKTANAPILIALTLRKASINGLDLLLPTSSEMLLPMEDVNKSPEWCKDDIDLLFLNQQKDEEFPAVKGWLDEDLDNYHLKELRCSTQCHTQMSMWIISRGVVLLILLMEYKYSANMRRTDADFSHAPPNEYSPSPDDKKQWSLVWFDFYKIPLCTLMTSRRLFKLHQCYVFRTAQDRDVVWGEACSFMLCDLDFEPLSLSLSSLPSCDLVSLTNMLILLHYLESFKSELAELSCLLKEQLLEPALNLTVHCCGREFRVLNGYDQKSFDEERGLN
ncbi:hypothetical protein Tco_1303245 [Tanacetum coccineum]